MHRFMGVLLLTLFLAFGLITFAVVSSGILFPATVALIGWILSAVVILRVFISVSF